MNQNQQATSEAKLRSEEISTAQKVFRCSLNTADIFWTAEVECTAVEYEPSAKVFAFADGSRLRVNASTDRAEVLHSFYCPVRCWCSEAAR